MRPEGQETFSWPNRCCENISEPLSRGVSKYVCWSSGASEDKLVEHEKCSTCVSYTTYHICRHISLQYFSSQDMQFFPFHRCWHSFVHRCHKSEVNCCCQNSYLNTCTRHVFHQPSEHNWLRRHIFCQHKDYDLLKKCKKTILVFFLEDPITDSNAEGNSHVSYSGIEAIQRGSMSAFDNLLFWDDIYIP